jgi:hypothetical protein
MGLAAREGEAKLQGALDIPQNPLDESKVRLTRIMHI